MKSRIVAIALLAIVSNCMVASGEDHSTVVPSSKDSEHLIELFVAGGRPVNNDADHPVKILVNKGYVVGYSEDRRNPLWSAYRASELKGNRQPMRFERAMLFFKDSRGIFSNASVLSACLLRIIGHGPFGSTSRFGED